VFTRRFFGAKVILQPFGRQEAESLEVVNPARVYYAFFNINELGFTSAAYPLAWWGKSEWDFKRQGHSTVKKIR